MTRTPKTSKTLQTFARPTTFESTHPLLPVQLVAKGDENCAENSQNGSGGQRDEPVGDDLWIQFIQLKRPESFLIADTRAEHKSS